MTRATAPWLLVAALALLQAGLAWATWARTRGTGVTYVFTPLVDVIPGGTPLGAVEAEALAADVRHQVDAREVQRAYGRMGSTLSLDELLRGIQALDAAGHPLSEAQRSRIGRILDAAAADHTRLIEVQTRILDLEARIDVDVAAVLAALPPDVQARVSGARP